MDEQRVQQAVQRLIEHVCGQSEFDEDKAFEGLEQVIEYDWQKRFVRLLDELNEATAR